MSNDTLTYEDLLRIVELIQSSERFSEFRLKIGDIEVELHRRGGGRVLGANAPRGAAQPTATSAAVIDAAPPAAHTPPPAATPDAAAMAQTSVPPKLPSDALVIRAPMVGTFYRAPEPGARPFVSVGDHVEPHTIVCIIEVMKLMNSIAAGTSGTVTHILIDDAAPVGSGEALIVVQPDRAAA